MLQLLLTLVLLLPSESRAASPFTPDRPNPILETWRWRQLSSTAEMFLTCMTEGPDGHLWFGSPDAVVRYDGLHWIRYREEDGLDGQPIVALVATDTETVAATSRGIYRLEGARWDRVFPTGGDQTWYIHDLVVTSAGTIWATSAFGLIQVAENETSIYTIEEIADHLAIVWPSFRFVPVPRELAPESRVSYANLGIQRSGDTILWVIPGSPADSAGLRVGDRVLETRTVDDRQSVDIQRPDGEIRTLSISGRPGEGPVRAFELDALCLTRAGELWSRVVTGAGAVHFDPTEERWTVHRTVDDFKTGRRIRFLEDDDDTIWMVSDDPTHGVYTFDGSRWTQTRLSSVGGTDRNPTIARTSDGTIWVGGQEGYLHAWRQGQWEVYRAPRVPIPKSRMLDLVASSEGALWILGDGRRPTRFDYATTRWSTYEGLNFQTGDNSGRLWFLERSGSIVSQQDEAWTRHDVSDGLIDTPTGIVAGTGGHVWVVGSHEGVAAAAQLDGENWKKRAFPDLSWSVDGNAARVLHNGSLWAGASTGWNPDQGHRGGIVRVSDKQIVRHTPPLVLSSVNGMAITSSGSVWIGSDRGLHHFDGTEWTRIEDPPELRSDVNTLEVTSDGLLLLGHQTRGFYRYDGTTWFRTGIADGLADNTVWSILDTGKGSIWAMTDRAISRFDGRAWTTPALPPELPTSSQGSLRQSRDGALWISVASESWHRRASSNREGQDHGAFRTVRYWPDREPPETRISYAPREVSQPGNITITWHGADRWHETAVSQIQYSWRIDGSTWSDFSTKTSHTFELLGSGEHRFEVRSRDLALNEDPSPATAVFTVLPPVWKQPWFLVLVSGFTLAVLVQTTRVVRRDRQLARSNEALTQANEDLTETNRRLEEARDQLVQSEKMASLGHLVAGVAHEVNNPIGAFSSAADTLKRCIERVRSLISDAADVEDVRGDRRYRQAMDLMTQTTDNALVAGERVKTIVDSLRHFAHLDESEYQKVDLREALDSIVTLRAHELAERIVVERSYADIPKVACYASELNQALMNVFVNAIDAIGGEGRIVLSTRTEGDEIVIGISDTGKGIPPDRTDRIFDPGFTTKGVGVGVGLGLATVYRVVEKHRGRIEVDSEVGKGSTFTIYIPTTDDRS